MSLVDAIDKELKEDGYWTIMPSNQVCAALGIKKWALRKYVRLGLMPKLPRSGMRPAYRRKDVAAFLVRKAI